MTPDSTPVFGATPFVSLWFNSGQGTLNWTITTGSGQVLADLISDRSPQIDTSDLCNNRYSRRNSPQAAVLHPNAA